MGRQTAWLLVLGVAALLIGFWGFGRTAESQNLVSPLLSSGRTAVNLWTPILTGPTEQRTGMAAPFVSARAAYFVDINTGRVLYEKNVHQRLPIASLTKIMTAIVALEHHSWSSQLTVSQHAAAMEPDYMQLVAGEKLSLEELLDGMFLVSANDAAEVLAEQTTGNRDEFVKLMNDKAALLGMQDSLFINPTGLEEDNWKQYSSAFDVVLMSRYAIKQFPHLVEITSQPFIFLPQTATHQDYTLYSGINLLTTYPGVVGLKTGYTPEAGLTLVTLAHRGGHQVLGVILGSGDRRGEARELLDYSFKLLAV